MAPASRIENVEEVRSFGGRPHDLAPDARIAGSLQQSESYLLLEELGDRFIPIPWKTVERAGNFSLPSDASFRFGRKDLTRFIKANWNTSPLMDQGKTGRERIARSLGVYDWVLNEKPDAVVVWTDAYPETRAAVMAGNDLRIPTIQVAHGGFRALMHGHFETKRFCKWHVGSWEFRRWMQFYGEGEGVIPTGSISMDLWARAQVDVMRAKARHAMKIPDHAPVVCYLEDAAYSRDSLHDDGFTEAAMNVFLRAFVLARTIIGDLHLVLKMHPYDRSNNPHERKELLEKVGIHRDFTIIDDNLPMALAASDVTCGMRSTAMVSGLMLGIPAIVTAFEPWFETEWYEGYGFKVVREPGDLLSALTTVLASKGDMLGLINECDKGARFFGSDGLASVRAVRAIGAILRGEVPGEGCYGSLP